jgi:hypothetical protein
VLDMWLGREDKCIQNYGCNLWESGHLEDREDGGLKIKYDNYLTNLLTNALAKSVLQLDRNSKTLL